MTELVPTLDGRPTEDAMLLDVARVVATRATCGRLHVGAVLAREGRVLSTGYNGAPAGLPHCTLHAVGESCRRAVHAETNAIAFAARHGVPAAGATLYLTHSPCVGCAGLLVNAGVVEVVYDQPYRDPAGIDLLERAGVLVRQHRAA